MPWTRKQVKLLLSDASPLSGGQKTNMLGELHANPAMGHMKKGSMAMNKPAATRPMTGKAKVPRGTSGTNAYDWRSRDNLKRGA